MWKCFIYNQNFPGLIEENFMVDTLSAILMRLVSETCDCWWMQH